MKSVLRAVTAAMTIAVTSGMASVIPAVAAPALAAEVKPYDVNGDGYADTVIGASGEDIGDAIDAGMLHILYGRSTGITTAGDQIIHQDTTGVPGATEEQDVFGAETASGDFNADGYADIAVSATLEDIGTVPDAGLVQVFYGSANGLRTSGVTGLEVPRPDLRLGWALAAGDFNGDGRDDLAAGGLDSGPGSFFVFYGSDTGLSTSYQEFAQGADGVPGVPHFDESFGASLSTGDINNDGHSDLAIGADRDEDDLGYFTGSVTLLYGSATGLNGNHDGQRFSKETPGVPGDSGGFGEGDFPDSFGYALTLADFNGDHRADLAVGAVGAPVSYDGVVKPDAGTITVLYSDGTRIGTDNAVEITQATPGIPGIPGRYDHLGLTVVGGDANGDGHSELAVFSDGDQYVTIIPGGLNGLVTASAKVWTQDSSGIPGVAEPGDYWGGSMRFADIKGVGRASLIVGATGENARRGAFTVIHSTSTGLTGTGSQAFSQDSYGVLGTAEIGDSFGAPD
jgi:hypothetical protein